MKIIFASILSIVINIANTNNNTNNINDDNDNNSNIKHNSDRLYFFSAISQNSLCKYKQSNVHKHSYDTDSML